MTTRLRFEVEVSWLGPDDRRAIIDACLDEALFEYLTGAEPEVLDGLPISIDNVTHGEVPR